MRSKVILALLLLSGVASRCQNLASPYSNSVFKAQSFTATGQTGAVIQLNGLTPTVSGSTVGSSYSSLTVTVAGTSLTTVTFAIQGSADNGATFFSLPIYSVASPVSPPTLTVTATANGLYQVNSAGLTHVRVVTSGTFTATSVSLTFTGSPNALISKSGSSGGGATTPATALVYKGTGAVNGVTPATPGIDYVIPSGNVATASALAGTPVVCDSGNAPIGVLPNGDATGCAPIGGGSTITSSPQFQIPYFFTSGVQPNLKGLSNLTTDTNGNFNNHTNTEVMTDEPNVGSVIQNSTQCLPSDCSQESQLKQFITNSWGFGLNTGNNGNTGALWRVSKGPQFYFNVFNSGIAQLMHFFGDMSATGDKALIYSGAKDGSVRGIWAGGATDASGEGDVGININGSQFVDYCTGTTTTTGTGATSPDVNCTNGFHRELVGGGYLFDLSHAVLSANIGGSVSSAWGPSSSSYRLGQLGLASTVATPSTGVCAITGSDIPRSTLLGVPQSHSFTCTSNSGFPVTTLTTGDSWIANPSSSEQVTITSVSGTSTITGTMLSADYHPVGSYIFQGGTQGCLSFDDDLSALSNLTDFPVFGASDSSHLIIGYPVLGGIDGTGLPYPGTFYEQPTSGIHVYPCAKILSLGSDGLSPVLEHNHVPWVSGDNIASPAPTSYLENGYVFSSTAKITNPNDQSKGFNVEGHGPGQTAAFIPFQYRNFFDPSKYQANGGRLSAPTSFNAFGPIGGFAAFDNLLPGNGSLCGGATVLCNVNLSGSTIDQQLYVDAFIPNSNITHHRLTNTWEFLGSLQSNRQLIIGSNLSSLEQDTIIIKPSFITAGFGAAFGLSVDYGSALPLAKGRLWYNLDQFSGPGIYCWYLTVDSSNAIPYKTCSNGSGGNMITSLTGTLNVNGAARFVSTSVLPTTITNDLASFDNSTGEIADSAIGLGGVCQTSGTNCPSIQLRLLGVTGSIGGSPLIAGTCATGTASVPGAVVGRTVGVSASDGSLPNPLISLAASVTTTNTVSVQACAIAAVTPVAVTYNVSTY